MTYDGILLAAVVEELQEILPGGRIDKIQQPTDDDLILIVRAQRTNYRLLLSANKSHPRMYLSTRFVPQNPSAPPMFCMLMRKHLEGGRIKQISQFGRERIAAIDIEVYNELGDLTTRRIMVEIMGKHSNILLLSEPDGVIIDAATHTPSSINRHREILPGRPYIYPPNQHKEDPFQANQDTFLEARSKAQDAPLRQFLVNHYLGVSPFFGQQIESMVDMTTSDTAKDEWHALERTLDMAQHKKTPTVLFDEQNRPLAYYVIDPLHLTGRRETHTSISDAMDVYYKELALSDITRSKTSSYLRLAKNELEKCRAKIDKLSLQLASQQDAEAWRIQGELLTAYLQEVKKGDEQVTLPNFYDDGHPMLILLDPAKSPLENANAYFRRYQKYKKGRHKTEEQLQIGIADSHYLESVLHELEVCSVQDLPGIEAELRETGLLRSPAPTGETKNKKANPTYAEYRATDGTPILVGRNNKENDYITFKMAKKTDTWLHVKDAPGSHVVLRSANPNADTLLEAAQLAVHYSKYRDSTKAPVDYVAVKSLWKPNHSKPGFVLFTGQRTLMVAMDREKIAGLIQQYTHHRKGVSQ